MKVFYTPAINGQYDVKAQARLADQPDNKVYALVEKMTGETGINELGERGYTKVLDRNERGNIKGYWTYQQDDL